MERMSNTILNAMSKNIFSLVKPTIINQISTMVREQCNQQLTLIPAQPFLNGEMSTPIDVAIQNAALDLKDQFDPLILPGIK